jgi:hypothetical protein
MSLSFTHTHFTSSTQHIYTRSVFPKRRGLNWKLLVYWSLDNKYTHGKLTNGRREPVDKDVRDVRFYRLFLASRFISSPDAAASDEMKF